MRGIGPGPAVDLNGEFCALKYVTFIYDHILIMNIKYILLLYEIYYNPEIIMQLQIPDSLLRSFPEPIDEEASPLTKVLT